jgi:hypothetical protein
MGTQPALLLTIISRGATDQYMQAECTANQNQTTLLNTPNTEPVKTEHFRRAFIGILSLFGLIPVSSKFLPQLVHFLKGRDAQM